MPDQPTAVPTWDPTAAPAAARRIVARQPVVDRDDRIVGFQLLHRSTPDTDASGELAAGHTISVAALLGDATVDVAPLVRDLQLYCEPGPGVLEGTTTVMPPAHRTVLEVPAERCADDEVLERCRALRKEGYSIAVDAVGPCVDLEAVLDVADVVKLDLEARPRDEVLDLVARCRPSGVALLAARCLTEDDLEWAADAGFELFQGPAVQRPVEVSGTTLAPSALAQVQLAAELLDDRLDFGRIETILAHEPALVVQVLRHASIGAGRGLRREVHSVREALVLMGSVRLRQWVALTVLGRQATHTRTDALAVALVRARMCELLAQQRGLDRGFAFTAGLLSALDRLLGVEIDQVQRMVDVDGAMAAAAFRRETPVGDLVGLVSDYQDAVADGQPAGPGLGDVELVAAMAFCWAMSHIDAMERTPAV